MLELTLNRPHVRNALDHDMEAMLETALQHAHDDPAVRAVTLTGAGGAFCAGADLSAMKSRPHRADLPPEDRVRARADERDRLTWAFANVVRLAELPQPTIAALQGPVAGAGIGLAAACDIRIAAASTRFAMAFARVGLPGDWGVTLLLSDLVGRARARQLLLRAAVVDAKEAQGLGLVDEVVPDDHLDDARRTLAAELAAGPSAAYAATKRLTALPGLRDRIRQEIEATLECQETADHAEGVRAFLDKRPPTFTGR